MTIISLFGFHQVASITMGVGFTITTDRKTKSTDLHTLPENIELTLRCFITDIMDNQEQNAFNDSTDSLTLYRQSATRAIPVMIATHTGISSDAPSNAKFFSCSGDMVSKYPCFTVVISSATRLDTGDYQCQARVYDRSNLHYTEVTKSKAVDFLYPPGGNLTCEPSYGSPVDWKDDSIIQLNCSSDSGNPNVTLEVDITDKNQDVLLHIGGCVILQILTF